MCFWSSNKDQKEIFVYLCAFGCMKGFTLEDATTGQTVTGDIDIDSVFAGSLSQATGRLHQYLMKKLSHSLVGFENCCNLRVRGEFLILRINESTTSMFSVILGKRALFSYFGFAGLSVGCLTHHEV